MFAIVPPPPQRLLVFARLPELGQVKTRLAASIGDERALAVYEAMLRELIGSIGDSTPETEIEFLWAPTPRANGESLRRAFAHHAVAMQTGRDLSVVLFGATPKVAPLIATSFNESNGDISPDGRWIAYQSDESGREEIYVRPFPDVDAGGRWQISPNGGSRPLWARNGRELFYLSADHILMTVPVQTTPIFSAARR